MDGIETATYKCERCPKRFYLNHAVVQHMNAVDHWAPRWECESCDDQFFSEERCNDHMNQHDLWAPKVECEACSSMFYTAAEARHHMDAYNHWRRHWCGPCQKGFQNENNLLQHLHSYAYLADSTPCPYCKKGHTTVSGVAHHIESGNCPNADREMVHKLINANDTRGDITNKEPMTQTSGNAQEYECTTCRRGFGSLMSVNQHLESNVHEQKIFHCINRSCGKLFSALAPLFNHLESESCGATRFHVVQEQAPYMLATGRVITV